MNNKVQQKELIKKVINLVFSNDFNGIYTPPAVALCIHEDASRENTLLINRIMNELECESSTINGVFYWAF